MNISDLLQKFVKRYACGYQARKDGKTKNTLKQAFASSSAAKREDEEKLFGEAIDNIMKTPTGRETLTALSKLGYSFHFDSARDCAGFCLAEKKKIVINPTCGFAYMLATIVHEGTHAIQKSLEKKNAPDYCDMKVADMIRCRRAIEADASAHQMAFAYECKDVLPAVYKKAQENDTPMFSAYVGEMEKSGDKRKAMQASFAAWYDYGYFLDGYDGNYKKNIRNWSEWGKKHNYDLCFMQDYPAKDVLKMCRCNGAVYMEPEFLNKGLAFSISVQDKKEINDMLQNYAGAFNMKADTSVLSMNSRSENGKLLNENKNVAAAFAAKAKQKGR